VSLLGNWDISGLEPGHGGYVEYVRFENEFERIVSQVPYARSVWVDVCMYVWVYVCMGVCMYVYIGGWLDLCMVVWMYACMGGEKKENERLIEARGTRHRKQRVY
jgi:hypothetical protein